MNQYLNSPLFSFHPSVVLLQLNSHISIKVEFRLIFMVNSKMVKLRWARPFCLASNLQRNKGIIDPFLTNNPKAAVKPQEIESVDFVLVTHDHFDHLGDAFEIAKNTNAKLIGIVEIAAMAQKAGVKKENAIGMNMGSISDLGKIRVGMIPAIHSGNMVGFVVSANGKTIYDAGDTAFFSDMKLIAELYKPDVALLPIGGFFTMGPLEAAIAADLIQAKDTMPMHYGTWPPIAKDPKDFAERVKKSTVHILNVGEEIEL
jgi:L-ascorbate metabolism protein UlaG (beta-lactamase superfamily)